MVLKLEGKYSVFERRFSLNLADGDIGNRAGRPLILRRCAGARPSPKGRAVLSALSTPATQSSTSALFPNTGIERGHTLFPCPVEALRKPCVAHERDMYPAGYILCLNFIFSAGSLNRAVSLVRHRANHASTPYCQGEAISHAGILENVANVGMLPVPMLPMSNWGWPLGRDKCGRGGSPGRSPSRRSRRPPY